MSKLVVDENWEEDELNALDDIIGRMSSLAAEPSQGVQGEGESIFAADKQQPAAGATSADRQARLRDLKAKMETGRMSENTFNRLTNLNGLGLIPEDVLSTTEESGEGEGASAPAPAPVVHKTFRAKQGHRTRERMSLHKRLQSTLRQGHGRKHSLHATLVCFKTNRLGDVSPYTLCVLVRWVRYNYLTKRMSQSGTQFMW